MASVKFRLNRPTQKESSILVRFYSKQTGPLDFSTGEVIPCEYWEGQRVSSKFRGRADRINKHLSKIEGDMLDIWRDNKGSSGDELKSLLKVAVKGESGIEKKTLIEVVTQFIAQYEREKEKTTVNRYRVLLRRLQDFNPKLTLSDLDYNFYTAFKNYLYDIPNPLYTGYHLEFDSVSGLYTVTSGTKPNNTIGLFDDVVFKYFINLKTILAWAEKRELNPHRSYRNWEVIKREYEPITLTSDELNKLESISFSKKHLDVARDYLAIECRTGQRISDLKRFTKADLDGDVWSINQKKGSRLHANKIYLPMVGHAAPALLILQKYNYELPKISEQKINEHIKTACRDAGITEDIYIERWAGNKKIRIPGKKYEFISSHTGRKTCITLMLQDPNFTTKMVMDITGIKSFKTLNHYNGKSEIGNLRTALEGMKTYKPLMKVS